MDRCQSSPTRNPLNAEDKHERIRRVSLSAPKLESAVSLHPARTNHWSLMHTPDAEQFAQLATENDFVPVYRRLLSDTLTPVTAFQLLDDGGRCLPV